MGTRSALAACLFLASARPAPAVEPVESIGSFSFAVRAGGFVFQVPYDAERSLSAQDPQVERAVVLLHGSSRSSSNAYDTLVEAAALSGAGAAATLLVAPQFLIEVDLASHALPADRLFWSDSGWKQGNASLSTAANPRPASLSSFAVMDSILHGIAARSPNLQTLVLAGHSAGGQFVHRYAAGSTLEDGLDGVDVQYVVANPSSYLYLDPQRVVDGTMNQFAVPPPAVVQSCPDYDDYKYGLSDRNAYMSRFTRAEIVARYPARHVVFLLGEEDVDPAAVDLDTSCAAMLQGDNRRERGVIYAAFLRHFYGPAIGATQPAIVVPGVGHSGHNVFTSPCGRAPLFGGGGCDPVAVEPAPAGPTPGLVLRPGRPNPFASRTTIAWAAADGRPATLCVYDVRGRLVRTLHRGPGSGAVTWDGRSSRGEPMPAGVYVLRLQQGGAAVSRRATRLP
jgi:hypothetical protein